MQDSEQNMGAIACPACGERVPLAMSKGRQFAFLSCDECGTQVYTRNRPASRMLEGRAVAPTGPAPAPAPAPKPEPKPARSGVDAWLTS